MHQHVLPRSVFVVAKAGFVGSIQLRIDDDTDFLAVITEKVRSELRIYLLKT
ncbi:hypothetical protein [Alteromonas sp. MMG017]|uniref:hypothetical protein n=1 Tax=Alteromonas sp. MMG017 TaxID=2822692 RepID=UPI001FFD5E61|nr:hypothetical protein [Alteromonas sp. MMG017]